MYRHNSQPHEPRPDGIRLWPNPPINRTAQRLRRWVPSALRAPAAGYLGRWGSMRSRFLALIFFAATPILAVAENSPSERSARAPSQYECGTNPGSVSENDCIDRRLRVLDIELTKAYQTALAYLPKQSDIDLRKERNQLRRSQLAWLKYKNENCDLVGGLDGDMAQTITFNALLCREHEVNERIRFLRKIANADEPQPGSQPDAAQ